jgi:hypothetical protein
MKRLLLALSSAAALWTAACSNGGSGVQPPPPTGMYSNASLNGQYAFMTNGESFAGGLSATPLARVGTFTADGNGHITGGVEDVNANGTVTNAILIDGTKSSYAVNADGRGSLTLVLGQNTINFGITLTSVNDGLMIDETSNSTQSSTGSGNFVKQNGAMFSVSSVSGPYVFDFPGLDGNTSSFCPCPESFLGEFTANNGVISNGFFDDNDNGTFSSGAFIGTLATDPLNPQAPIGTYGRGIAQIAGQSFVFYIVDGTRVRFLTSTGGMLSGDGVSQSANVPTSTTALNTSFVFIVAGSSANGGVTRIGRFTASGASVTNVLMDTNNAGVFTLTNSGTSASISFDAANPGRGTVTFKDPNLSVPFTFVFYLSSAASGVIQEQSQSTTQGAVDVADGSIEAQSGGPFTSTNVSGTYAFNWSGLSLQNGGSFAVQDEEDVVGQVKVASLALTGAADSFQFQVGIPVFDEVASGSILINGDGTGSDGKRTTMSVKLTKVNSITVNSVVYIVNPQLAFFTNNQDKNRIIAGILKMQQ